MSKAAEQWGPQRRRCQRQQCLDLLQPIPDESAKKLDYLNDLSTLGAERAGGRGPFAVTSDAIRRWYVSVKTVKPRKK